jgi:hypothetical protein
VKIIRILLIVSIGLTICFAGNGFAANHTVSNTNESGTGSLLQAMTDALSGSEDTITISNAGTITLSSSLPIITKSMTINGPGVGSLTIDGKDLYSIFYVNGSNTVAINNLTIVNGFGPIVYGYITGGGGVF